MSKCPSPTLWFLHAKQRIMAQNFKSTMGPSPHLRFLQSKRRDLHQNIKSTLVPALICGFVLTKQRLFDRNNKALRVPDKTCLLCIENSNFSTWITSLYLSQPSSVVFACKTAHFGPEFQVSMGPTPHLRFLHAKQRVLAQNYKSLWVPDMTCRFVDAKQRD